MLLNQHDSKSVITPVVRRFLSSVLVFVLSACNQIDGGALQDSSDIQKQQSPDSIVYGRETEFSYPKFSGIYSVGTRTILLTDPARLEYFTSRNAISNEYSNRTIQVRFYYPRENLVGSNTNKLPVIAPATWQYLIGHQHAKGKYLRFENYRKAKWNIEIGQPINQSRASYPILIFSHGYGYNAEAYSALSAELASRGFIVASINHTYGANPVDLGEGKLIWATPLKKESIGSYLPIWSSDQLELVDYLSIKNSDSSDPFFQKLDLANIGIFGHSYGGAAAFQTASKDPRIKAVMDIDGTLFDYKDEQIDQPFALLLSKNHRSSFNFKQTFGPSYLVKLKNFEHASFTDHILWWQWDHDDLDLGFGKVDSYRAVELTTNIVDQFFSHYLLNKASPLFEVEHIDTIEYSLDKK